MQVFEKRPHPEPMPAPDDSKAYLLNLNERAFNAFHKAGVNTDILVERCNGKSGTSLTQQFLKGCKAAVVM